MSEWFDEYWKNHTGRNRFFTTGYYNPSSGEFYLYNFLGLASFFGSCYILINYMIKQEAFIAVLLGAIAFLVGIIGLVLSIKNLPYAFRCRSLYRVLSTFAGIVSSLGGMLISLLIFAMIFLPRDILVSIFDSMNI